MITNRRFLLLLSLVVGTANCAEGSASFTGDDPPTSTLSGSGTGGGGLVGGSSQGGNPWPLGGGGSGTAGASCGFVPQTPADPSPDDGETDVNWDTLTTLTWDESLGANTYDVYFSDTCPLPDYPEPPYMHLGETEYPVPPLTVSTTYCWRVVALANHDCYTVGPEWTFTTACDDPVAGPPTVTSTDMSFPASGTGAYTLTFSEGVNDVATNLTWTPVVGSGTMGTISTVDPQTYTVNFSGVSGGDSYTLTVGTGITDECAKPLTAAVDITLTISSEDVYSDSFTMGQTPSTQCSDWKAFRASLTGPYNSVTIRGSFDLTGVTCPGSQADQICQALKAGSSTTSVSCGGRTWNVGDCGTNSTEINSATQSGDCACWDPSYIVRPCIGNSNWGGANTDTCGGPSQTLEVVCGY